MPLPARLRAQTVGFKGVSALTHRRRRRVTCRAFASVWARPNAVRLRPVGDDLASPGAKAKRGRVRAYSPRKSRIESTASNTEGDRIKSARMERFFFGAAATHRYGKHATPCVDSIHVKTCCASRTFRCEVFVAPLVNAVPESPSIARIKSKPSVIAND